MFDASEKFNVEIKNVGTEPVRVRATIDRSDKACRVLGVPGPDVLAPGETMMLIAYEPGILYKIEPVLRSADHPLGMFNPVPVEFGEPGVIERVVKKAP